MTILILAAAFAIAAPAAAQSAPVPAPAQPHQDHGQHRGHGQHQQHGGHSESRHCECCRPAADGQRPACCQDGEGDDHAAHRGGDAD